MLKIILKSHVIVNALRVFYSPVKLVKSGTQMINEVVLVQWCFKLCVSFVEQIRDNSLLIAFESSDLS